MVTPHTNSIQSQASHHPHTHANSANHSILLAFGTSTLILFANVNQLFVPSKTARYRGVKKQHASHQQGKETSDTAGGAASNRTVK
jgi:hypothetical protein